MRRLWLVAALVVFDIGLGAIGLAHWHSQQRPESVKTTALQSTKPVVVTTTTTTTVAPTTTSPPAPRKVIRAPVAEPTSSGDLFDRLAMCETGMHNDTSGPYYGYFQFLPSTWHSMGLSGMPYDYDYATQKDAAQRLVARSGWGQFPACSYKIGAR
jgi:hypothetical protein